mgnify:CR=1 FL=1
MRDRKVIEGDDRLVVLRLSNYQSGRSCGTCKHFFHKNLGDDVSRPLCDVHQVGSVEVGGDGVCDFHETKEEDEEEQTAPEPSISTVIQQVERAGGSVTWTPAPEDKRRRFHEALGVNATSYQQAREGWNKRRYSPEDGVMAEVMSEDGSSSLFVSVRAVDFYNWSPMAIAGETEDGKKVSFHQNQNSFELFVKDS